MSEANVHRWGTVALAGRPNVGKSTLLNALAGQKLSIVTPKPQTTRHRVEGAVSGPGFRMILSDTPGSGATGGSRLAHAMNREGDAALSAADAAILVVAAPRWTRGDDAALERLRRTGLPIVLAVNKIDGVKPRMALLPFLERAAGKHDFSAIVPVSAYRAENLEALVRAAAAHLPAGAAEEAPAPLDRGERFAASEALREQLMLVLNEELPYGIAVEIEEFREGSVPVYIRAVMHVERESQKRIVIGSAGQRIREIGRSTREKIEPHVGGPVFLDLWVKVLPNWRKNAAALERLGYRLPADPT